MATSVADRRKRISEATKELIDGWKEGVNLESSFSSTIDEMLRRAASARWRLAAIHLDEADKLFKARPPRYRSAISRFYYSMYQAMRACVFLSHGGDDHEEHSILPQHIPRDFPDKTVAKSVEERTTDEKSGRLRALRTQLRLGKGSESSSR